MEIKTCEQYVLKQLEETENENAQLKRDLEDASELMSEELQQIKTLQSKFDRLCEILKHYGKYVYDEKQIERRLTINIRDNYSCDIESMDFNELMQFCTFDEGGE